MNSWCRFWTCSYLAGTGRPLPALRMWGGGRERRRSSIFPVADSASRLARGAVPLRSWTPTAAQAESSGCWCGGESVRRIAPASQGCAATGTWHCASRHVSGRPTAPRVRHAAVSYRRDMFAGLSTIYWCSQQLDTQSAAWEGAGTTRYWHVTRSPKDTNALGARNATAHCQNPVNQR